MSRPSGGKGVPHAVDDGGRRPTMLTDFAKQGCSKLSPVGHATGLSLLAISMHTQA